MTAPDLDVSKFEPGAQGDASGWHLIVKSLDQVERRAGLIEAKQRGRIGRIEERPVATGLWVRGRSKIAEFREPRGLARVGDGRFLLAEVGSVLLVDSEARILQRFSHPFFAFLHSVSFDPANNRFLVVSSGYDCLIEMDLGGRVTWEWFAWEHGFNPSLDGVYLCRDAAVAQKYGAEGKPVALVDPGKLGAHGLMTSQRSNHPNSACYHPWRADRVLATLGHSGQVIEIERESGSVRTVLEGLEAMPHAIQPHGGGWMVTNTLKGEFWLLGRDFALERKVVTRDLPGKPAAMAAHEWLQAAYPLGNHSFAAVDANRGLITIDLEARRYRIDAVDESWCVHHLLVPL